MVVGTFRKLAIKKFIFYIIFICVTKETPYVMMHNSKNYTGNARFYGFCVDILDRVAQQVGFDYILDLVPDRKYGAKDPITGEWNGMVHQLMKHVNIHKKWSLVSKNSH